MTALLVVVALAGWSAALAAVTRVVRARRRLERVARAEHELRGPTTVLLLVCARMAREPAARRHARALEVELERIEAGLADLTAIRTGRRTVPSRGPGESSADLRAFAGAALAGWTPALRAADRRVRLDWKAGSVRLPADRGRLAQVLGNLVANAAEHGVGTVTVRGRRLPGGVRVEVQNDVRGARGVEVKAAADPGWQATPRTSRGRGLVIAAQAAQELGGRIATERDERAFHATLELPLDGAASRDATEQRMPPLAKPRSHGPSLRQSAAVSPPRQSAPSPVPRSAVFPPSRPKAPSRVPRSAVFPPSRPKALSRVPRSKPRGAGRSGRRM